MVHGISIRLANQGDAQTLVEFNQAMAKETEGKDLPIDVVSDGVRGLLMHPQYGFYLVAEADGEVIGSLMITYEWSDWRNGLFWWIQSVYVRPDYRGKGIYKRLYENTKTIAFKAGTICGFRLYVEKENVYAQKTYQALGMIKTRYRIFEEVMQNYTKRSH